MDRVMKKTKIYLVVALLLVVISILATVTQYSTRVITEKAVENHQKSIVSEAAKTLLQKRLSPGVSFMCPKEGDCSP